MGLMDRLFGRREQAAGDELAGQILAGIERDARAYAVAVAKAYPDAASAKRFFGETASSADDIYGSWMGTRRYNPDDLSAKKGGLKIYKEMRQDDQVKASLHVKKAAIVKAGWSIECDDETVKKFLEYAIDAMSGTVEEAVLSILSAFDYGFSLHEIVYRYFDEGPHKGKVGLAALRQKSPTRIQFDVDEYGNVLPDGIVQRQDNGELRRLLFEKFLLFSYQKEFDNHYGESDLRAAYRFWFLKTNFFRYWAMYLERFGMPLALGISERASLAPDQQQAFRDLVKNIQAGMSAVLPADLKIEFKEAAQSRGDTFSKAVDACDIRIARSILMPQLVGLAPQGETGSLARAGVEADTLDLILGAVSRSAADVLTERVLRPLVRVNFGAGRVDAKFVFNPMREEDKQAIAKAWGELVSKKAAHSTIATEKHVRTLLGFPKMTPEEETEAEDARKAGQGLEGLDENGRPAPPDKGNGKVNGKGNGLDKGKVYVLTTMNPQEARKAWKEHVSQLDDLEDEARDALSNAFEGAVQALAIDAKKKS